MKQTDRDALTVEMCNRVFGDCTCKRQGYVDPVHVSQPHTSCNTAYSLASWLLYTLPENHNQVQTLVAAGKKLDSEVA